MGQRLLASGFWVTAGRFGTQLAGFVINVLIVRLLVPDAVGGYFLIVSLVTVAVALSQVGLQSAIVRLVSTAVALGQVSQAAEVVAGAMQLVAAFGVLVAGLLAVVGPWLAETLLTSPAAADGMRLAALWVLTLSLGAVLAEAFRGYHRYAAAAVFGGLLTNALVLACCAILVFRGAATTLSDLLTVIVCAVLFNLMIAWRRIAVVHGVNAFARSPVRGLLRIGLPLMVTSVAIVFISQADLWVVGFFGAEQDVALYGSAVRLGQLVYIPLLICNALLPPFIAELFAQERTVELERITRSMASLALVPATLAFCIFLFMGNSVLSTVYGSFYAPAALPLVLLTAGQLVNMWAGSAIVTLIMTGYERDVMYITIGSGFLLVISTAILMPIAGVNGVAAASGVVAAASGIFSQYRVRRLIGIRTSASLRHLAEGSRELFVRLAHRFS